MQLTSEFNRGRLRAVLCGGQAVVLHRLAIMSKDAYWILKEDDETMKHVLAVLEKHNAHYRFGAPLEERWMAGGWSAHLEFRQDNLRLRTDFVSRPARLDAETLKRIWNEQKGKDIPFVNARDLAKLKKTNREKDYAVIGELARRMENIDDRILFSRSARDLVNLASEYPDRVKSLSRKRPVLEVIPSGISRLEAALDAERRRLMHANEERIVRYMTAAREWADMWRQVADEIKGRRLSEAHSIMTDRAENVLPFNVDV